MQLINVDFMEETDNIQDNAGIAARAIKTLPFKPLTQQLVLLNELEQFVTQGAPNGVFVLNGYAGTGKTSMVGAFIKAMVASRHRIKLVAPTGRAAKVAQALANFPASTIHKLIYRSASSDPSCRNFFMAHNSSPDTTFVVDEASLISDRPDESGHSLLSNLIRYVYSCPGCRMLLVGDYAQLPPVGQDKIMAMNPDQLREYGLEPTTFSLDLPVRQSAMSGIIHNATHIRQLLLAPRDGMRAMLFAREFPDIEVVSGNDLADKLAQSWREAGNDETLIITRSNWRANDFNRAIRNMVMYAEEPLERGDRIVISKNDYYWGPRNERGGLIANGETAEVVWVGRTQKAYGRYFTDVELRMAGEENPIGAKIMLRSLTCEGPAIPRQEMQEFYTRVMAAYDGEISEKIKGTTEDPYYNALQVKYAYCVTCHKAQGGQWKHVYIDMAGIPTESIGADFYRWLYTAITRATERLFFINPSLPVK